jgi:hypothetical protein
VINNREIQPDVPIEVATPISTRWNILTIMAEQPIESRLVTAVLYPTFFSAEKDMFENVQINTTLHILDLLNQTDKFTFLQHYASFATSTDFVAPLIDQLDSLEQRFVILQQITFVKANSTYNLSHVLKLIKEKNRLAIVIRNMDFITDIFTFYDTLTILPAADQNAVAVAKANLISDIGYLIRTLKQYPALDKFRFTKEIPKKILVDPSTLYLLNTLLKLFPIEQRFTLIDSENELEVLSQNYDSSEITGLFPLFTVPEQLLFFLQYGESVLIKTTDITHALAIVHEKNRLIMALKYYEKHAGQKNDYTNLGIITFLKILQLIGLRERAEFLMHTLELIIKVNRSNWSEYRLREILKLLPPEHVLQFALKYMIIIETSHVNIMALLPDQDRSTYARELLRVNHYQTSFVNILLLVPDVERTAILTEFHQQVMTWDDALNSIELLLPEERLAMLKQFETREVEPFVMHVGESLNRAIALLPVPTCFSYTLHILENTDYADAEIANIFERSQFNEAGQVPPSNNEVLITWLRVTLDYYKEYSVGVLEKLNNSNIAWGALSEMVHSYLVDTKSFPGFFQPAEAFITTFNHADERLSFSYIKSFFRAIIQFNETIDEFTYPIQDSARFYLVEIYKERLAVEKDFVTRIRSLFGALGLACFQPELNRVAIKAQLKLLAKIYVEFMQCDQSQLKFFSPAFGNYLMELHDIGAESLFITATEKLLTIIKSNVTNVNHLVAAMYNEEEEKNENENSAHAGSQSERRAGYN